MKAVERHRSAQHAHALERLRERYLPDASIDDLMALRDMARDESKRIKALPGSDAKVLFVHFAGEFMQVVYVPRFDAIRTVLPT